MRCLRQIASPPKGISGKWQGASYCPVVVAIVSLLLIANTRWNRSIFTIGWTDYNFLGGGRQFSVTGTYSNVNSTFDVKLLQPRFLSPKSSLILEASQQQQSYQTYTGIFQASIRISTISLRRPLQRSLDGDSSI